MAVLCGFAVNIGRIWTQPALDHLEISSETRGTGYWLFEFGTGDSLPCGQELWLTPPQATEDR